jgi:hypothetical protein
MIASVSIIVGDPGWLLGPIIRLAFTLPTQPLLPVRPTQDTPHDLGRVFLAHLFKPSPSLFLPNFLKKVGLDSSKPGFKFQLLHS